MNPAILLSSLANHLWQSTLFVLLIALLTLPLTKNRAHCRYWLWVLASLKFLIPFSLFIALGSYLGSHVGAIQTSPQLTLVITEISQPFPRPSSLTVEPSDDRTVPPVTTPAFYSPIIIGLWVLGTLVISLRWIVAWQRISLIVRRGPMITSGIAIDTLTRLQGSGPLFMPMKLNPDSLEFCTRSFYYRPGSPTS
jgi:hypothetical protein